MTATRLSMRVVVLGLVLLLCTARGMRAADDDDDDADVSGADGSGARQMERLRGIEEDAEREAADPDDDTDADDADDDHDADIEDVPHDALHAPEDAPDSAPSQAPAPKLGGGKPRPPGKKSLSSGMFESPLKDSPLHEPEHTAPGAPKPPPADSDE